MTLTRRRARTSSAAFHITKLAAKATAAPVTPNCEHENDPQHQVGDQTGTDPAYGCTLVAGHDQYVARRARSSIEELRESQYPDRSCPNVKARTERVEIDTG